MKLIQNYLDKFKIYILNISYAYIVKRCLQGNIYERLYRGARDRNRILYY